MNKKLIIGLVTLMGISLLGIVAVQFYWFTNSVKASNELFDRSVNEALNKAVRKMETNRDIRIIQQFSQHSDSDRIVQPPIPPPPVPGHLDVLIERDSIRQHMKVIARSRRPLGRANKAIRIDSTLASNFRQFKVTHPDSGMNSVSDFFVTEDSDSINLRFGQKARQLEVLARQIVTEYRGWETGRNIDMDQLKENIHNELNDKNIPIGFNYAIMAGDSVLNSNIAPSPLITRKWYRVNLFPNDIFRRGLELAVFFPEKDSFIGRTTSLLLGSSVIFILVILASFILSIYFILRQKKISEMKSDFINNMTHEFKTPIATISVAADSILNQKVIHDPEKVSFFTGMIKKENKRMNEQVEQILQIARLDRKEFEFRFRKVDAHELIGEAIQSIAIQVERRGGKIDTQLNATYPIINTDPVHFTNMIYNLLDNANKYSPENPEISVRTLNDPKGLIIIVEDHGIGMTKAVIGKIFEKLYRQPTGNIHNIKGFGLGLSYVKAILEANQGEIKVHSELGKGSRFEVFIPFLNKE